MICKKCSATIIDGGIYCPICGARVDGNKVCLKCEKLIQENSVFCSFCGTRQTEDVVVVDSPKTTSEERTNEVPTVTPIVDTMAVSTECTTTTVLDDSASRTDSKNTEVSVTENKKNCCENYSEDSIAFYELPKELDDKTFYANALTKIALDKSSPDDIFVVGKFDPVKTEYRQYVLGKGTANIVYSATIGYDREVEYKEYNSTSKSYVDKTKTVTDWQPFSGNYTGECIEATPNDRNTDFSDAVDYLWKYSDSAKRYNANTSKAPAPLAPSSSSISKLENNIKYSVSSDCERKLPGDRHKDFNSSGDVSLSLVESHVAPQSILKYKYLDSDYILKSHSGKICNISGNIPTVEKEIEMEIENNKLVKTFNIATFFTLLFCILSAILLPIALKITFTSIAVIMFIANGIVKANVEKEIYTKKQSKKKNDLISLLMEKGIKIPKQLQEEV